MLTDIFSPILLLIIRILAYKRSNHKKIFYQTFCRFQKHLYLCVH